MNKGANKAKMFANKKMIEVKEEFIETDNIKKFAEPEDVKKYQLCEEPDEKEAGEHQGQPDHHLCRLLYPGLRPYGYPGDNHHEHQFGRLFQ